MSADPIDRADDVRVLNRVYQAFLDAAQDALAIIDPQGQVIASNASFAAMWNVPTDKLPRLTRAGLDELVLRQIRHPAALKPTDPQPGLAEPVVQVDTLEHLDGRVLERRVTSLLVGDGSIRRLGWTLHRWRDVTDSMRTEQSLRTTGARATAIFNHALNAIVLVDDQQRCLDANPAACELLGLSLGQMRDRIPSDVLRLSADRIEASWSAFLLRGSADGHCRVWRPDGTPRDARFHAVAGIQPGVNLVILFDASDEIRSRQLQLDTAAQMESAMANADIVFWVVDLVEDQVTSANPQWLQQVLGYRAEDIASGIVAWDALVHPDDYDAREAAWIAHVRGHSPRFEAEFRMRHREGHWVWLLARGKATERDSNGLARRVVGTRIDITQRKLAEQALERLAFSDGLTGALNRRRFLDLAAVEIDRARRHGQPMAVLVADLDHFKAINDRHGHAAGDKVLKAFVQTVSTILRGSDLFARIGGEEFAGLLPQTDVDGVMALAQRLLAAVRASPVVVDNGAVPYSVSIGVALLRSDSPDAATIESLLGEADRALYLAKNQGRDRAVLSPPN